MGAMTGDEFEERRREPRGLCPFEVVTSSGDLTVNSPSKIWFERARVLSHNRSVTPPVLTVPATVRSCRGSARAIPEFCTPCRVWLVWFVQYGLSRLSD